MKRITIISSLFSVLFFALGCSKWAEDKSDIYAKTIAAGVAVSPNTPLKGSVKGVMLAGNTYTIDSDVYIPKGDTLLVQSGVTINVLHGSGIIVQGVFACIGSKDAPNIITVPGVTKNNTPGLAPSQDSAHIGLWKGIIGDTSCRMMVVKWTHIDFAGNAYGATVAANVANVKAGTSYNILFQNLNGCFIFEDNWVYGGTDDCIRVTYGRIHMFRNTLEKCGGAGGGDIFNVKGGTIGTMAYNFFIGTAYNGQKASDASAPAGAPPTHIIMYNSTFINDGLQVVPGQRGSTIDFEQGANGAFYNNLSVNCRVGYRVVNNPAADTLNLSYGYNYQWADSLVIANNFFTFGPVCTKPQSTDLPNPSAYLPASWFAPGAGYDGPLENSYNGAKAVQVAGLNPMFVNYPLPRPTGEPSFSITAITNYNFHLQPSSPLIGKGTTTLVQPDVVVPIDSIYGASEVTPPGADLGCYQANGSGNQH